MLRKAMGHKRSRERMAAICQKLIDGMKKNGIAEDIAMRIYNQINAFADYGFPESHAASFALLVFASAYLKHYYAPEFTAAILNAQPMGFYAPGTLIEDAKRHGVRVLPIDVRYSRWDHTLQRPRGENGKWKMENGRAIASLAHSPFSILHFRRSFAWASASSTASAQRQRRSSSARAPTGRSRRWRTSCGARDSTAGIAAASRDGRRVRRLSSGPNRTSRARRAALWQSPRCRSRRRGTVWRLAGSGKRGGKRETSPRASRLAAPASRMSPGELTEADYRMTGVSLNGHPMLHLRPLVTPNGVLSAAEIAQRARDGDASRSRDSSSAASVPATAKGFVFLTLEDETGIVNVVITPKRFERQALLISTTPLLLVRGVLQIEQRVVNVRAENFRALQAELGAEYAKSHDFH